MSDNATPPRFMRDVAAAVLRHVSALAAALVLTPVLVRSLGAAGFGYWSLVGTSAFLLGLADFGLNTSTLRAAAGHDAAAAKRATRYAARVTATASVPFAAACWFWLASVAEKLPMEAQSDARAAAAIALAAGILHATAQAFRSYAHGQGRIVALAKARAFGSLTQLVATLVALFITKGVRAVAIGYAAAVLVETLGSLRAAKDGVVAPGLPTPAERTELRRVGRHALFTNLAVAVCIRADVFVLEHVTSLESMGAYAVASRVVDQGFTLVKQLSAALSPRLGARSADRATVVRQGTIALGVLAAAPLGAVAVAGAPLIVLWAGPAVNLPILPVALAWLSLAAVIAAVDEVATSSLFLGGNSALAARAIVYGTILNVSLSVLGAYVFGPWAVAAATAVGNVLTAAVAWRAVRESLSWGPQELTTTFLAPFAAGAVAAGVAVLVRPLHLHPIVHLSFATLIATGVALAVAKRVLRAPRVLAS